MLEGKKILLGITGSIAAYKSIALVRLLVKQGAEVKVIMTPAAADFVSPLVLSTLSKNEVLSEIFSEQTWANHVALGRWADIFLIAPLSCNTLAKMAQGLCDNLLLSVYLSATCPVAIAPAMDDDMWRHPATRANLETLRRFGHQIVMPRYGELASGLVGEGRMEEPGALSDFLSAALEPPTGSLAGKKVLITAGPTQEALDPVRFIGNHSSGKMGISLAKEAARRGAEVTLVLGPVMSATIPEAIQVIRVRSAEEMYQACHERFATMDIALLAAAVADYRPADYSETKIKKGADEAPALRLIRTKDILKSLGAIKRPDQVLLGFALETDNEKANALEKLRSKNADFIVLNSLREGVRFGSEENKITIFGRDGSEIEFETKSKDAVAADILDQISAYTATVTV
ncbi:bifunctional phosphopantothenoylcysteine decarboxylase/phosphopantothenate--cysteine ligase CoaBC [Niabella terrae]